MDEEGTVLLPGPFYSEHFYPSHIRWSKIITMPFQTCIGKKITSAVTVSACPQATPTGKQMPW
jgi:hypothetical protein